MGVFHLKELKKLHKQKVVPQGKTGKANREYILAPLNFSPPFQLEEEYSLGLVLRAGMKQNVCNIQC